MKTMYISFIIFIPITILMIFSENVLSLWMKGEENIIISQIAGRYCIASIPGLFFSGLYFIFKGFLNA
jgi:Na+-driven multidrug efflux pump